MGVTIIRRLIAKDRQATTTQLEKLHRKITTHVAMPETGTPYRVHVLKENCSLSSRKGHFSNTLQ